MELIAKNPNDISLPGGIADSGLSLAEIGVITVLACIQAGESDAAQHFTNGAFQKAFRALKDRGPVDASLEGNKFVLRVNLEPLGL